MNALDEALRRYSQSLVSVRRTAPPAKARYARKAKELYGRKSGARNSGRESEKSAFKNHFSAFSKFIETPAKIAEKDGLFSF